jgi:hypothetical protein
MRRLSILIVAALVSLGAPAASAQTPEATPELLDRVYQCAALTDDAGRLACYDGAVERLRSAERQGEIVAVDSQRAETVQRESFGFHLPNLTGLLPRANNAALEQVETQVERVLSIGQGRHRFVLANGQSWVQVESRGVGNVRAGDTVAVRRAALGSFMLVSSRGGPGHRVRREE